MQNRDEKIVKLHDVNAGRPPRAATSEGQSQAIENEHPVSDSQNSGHNSGQSSGKESSAPEAESWGKKAPNVLTVLRILAVPFFVFLLTSPTPQSRLWATAIFLGASLTDWLDGYLARIYKAESILGTLLDPVADKVLVTAALVMLSAEGGELRVPAWIVVVILSRDLLVSGLRSLAAVRGTVVAASRAAKHKTAWTMVAIAFLLVGQTYQIYGTEVNFHVVGMIVLWVSLFLSIISGLDYAIKLRRMFV